VRICMLNLTSGGMSGGYRTYLSHLVPRLANHPDVDAMLVGAPQSLDISPWQRAAPSVQWLPLKCSLLNRGGEISRVQKRVIKGFAPDVLFIPTARYWRIDGVPVVTMVRNMIPMMAHNSTYCLERIRNWARFKQLQAAVRKSDRIVAISYFVKDCLTNGLGIREDKIGVVYHGLERHGNEPGKRPSAIPEDWSGGFVFAAGLIYPYRGIEDQIEAWHCLRSLPDLPPLVIAGKVGQGMSRYYAKLRRLVHDRGMEPHIHFVGLLDRPEMVWCYRNCLALVMTSRVEACPNIALEAMAHGCVCIAAQNPPLPEFFAEAAEYYPPGQPQSLAQAVRLVLDRSSGRCTEMSARALVRASRFSWDVCCDETIRELRTAVERH